MANDYEIERELGWNDAIERDAPDLILLPEGEYDFTVDHFDRERFNGSDKMPACNKAVIYLNVETPDGVAIIRESLFLHTKGEGKLCAFFTAIGQRQHGQRVNMNWNAVPGAKGRARIGIREYQGKQYNEVKKYLEPGGRDQGSEFRSGAQCAPPNAPAYQQPAYQPAPPPQATNYQYQQPQPGGYVPGKF